MAQRQGSGSTSAIPVPPPAYPARTIGARQEARRLGFPCHCAATFQQQIISQLQGGNLSVAFDDDQLGKLIRYMTQYGPGGFQGRLRKAFQRPLLELVAA